MFDEDTQAAGHGGTQENNEQPNGAGTAFYDGSEEEQEESVEQQVSQIPMQEPARDQTPVLMVNRSAIRQGAKAKQSGASFHLEPMTMEGVGRFAVIADPQGAVFAIFQSMARK